jgi:hypothetical protein
LCCHRPIQTDEIFRTPKKLEIGGRAHRRVRTTPRVRAADLICQTLLTPSRLSPCTGFTHRPPLCGDGTPARAQLTAVPPFGLWWSGLVHPAPAGAAPTYSLRHPRPLPARLLAGDEKSATCCSNANTDGVCARQQRRAAPIFADLRLSPCRPPLEISRDSHVSTSSSTEDRSDTRRDPTSAVQGKFSDTMCMLATRCLGIRNARENQQLGSS